MGVSVLRAGGSEFRKVGVSEVEGVLEGGSFGSRRVFRRVGVWEVEGCWKGGSFGSRRVLEGWSFGGRRC